MKKKLSLANLSKNELKKSELKEVAAGMTNQEYSAVDAAGVIVICICGCTCPPPYDAVGNSSYHGRNGAKSAVQSVSEATK